MTPRSPVTLIHPECDAARIWREAHDAADRAANRRALGIIALAVACLALGAFAATCIGGM